MFEKMTSFCPILFIFTILLQYLIISKKYLVLVLPCVYNFYAVSPSNLSEIIRSFYYWCYMNFDRGDMS